MKTLWSKRLGACLFALFCFQQIVSAMGVVTNCDEVSLRAAMLDGGTVTFACDGTITLSGTAAITSDTTFDATGRSVIISGAGGSAIRLFMVESNVTFVLKSLTLADGLARGTNGGPAIDGGPGEGGGIYNNGGTVSALNCGFLRNSAEGGEGGTGPNFSPRNGSGGASSGGAIYNNGGFLNATNCTFVLNYSLGGTGAIATGGAYSVSSIGGDAKGGAIHNQEGGIQLVACLVSSNQALAGPGRRFSVLDA